MEAYARCVTCDLIGLDLRLVDWLVGRLMTDWLAAVDRLVRCAWLVVVIFMFVFCVYS